MGNYKAPILPNCEQKERLRLSYNTARKTYAAAVDAANLGRADGLGEGYAHLRTLMSKARKARDDAFRALDEHKREHGC